MELPGNLEGGRNYSQAWNRAGCKTLRGGTSRSRRAPQALQDPRENTKDVDERKVTKDFNILDQSLKSNYKDSQDKEKHERARRGLRQRWLQEGLE